MKTVPDKAGKATGMVTLTDAGDRLAIKFSYDPAVIQNIKTLSDRRWHSADKRWTAALTAENVLRLRSWGFTLDNAGELAKIVVEAAAREMTKDVRLDFGELDGVLDPLQKDGVRLAEAFGGRVLFADDPGVGKTAQCLAYARLHPELRPAVIIAKKTGKLVWQRAAKRGVLTSSGDYFPLLPDDKVQVLYGEQDAEIDADVIIANYDILARSEPCESCGGEGEHQNGMKCAKCKGGGVTVYLRGDVAAVRPRLVIFDEPQMISNWKAQRTIACRELAADATHLLAATASPIKRRPRQFFTVLNMLRRDLFPNFFQYGVNFCAGTKTRFGWNFEGASNLEELNRILVDNLMVRRTSRQAFGDLPVNRQVVPLDIKNRGEYEAAEEDFMGWLKRKGDADRLDRAERAEALVKISTLLRMAAERKRDAVIEWLSEWFETNDGKIIVFTMHTELLNRIVAEFADMGAMKIDGSCSEKQRRIAEESFQGDDGCRLIVCQSDAGGDTWTGSAAYDVVFAELPRTSEDVKQNEGRAYARRNNPHGINSWFLVAADTIEERRAEQLNEGARVVGAALDGRPMDCEDDIIKLMGRK